MNVLFTSAALNSSGYAEASRNYICALNKQKDVNLGLRMVSFENWKTEIGEEYKNTILSLMNNKITPDVQIIHLTPENYRPHKLAGIKNIGYTTWETSHLPNNWVPMLNQMDEIWVPCDWNIATFKESGVTCPVKKVPHTFNAESFSNVPAENRFNIPKDKFIFYSIFQWSARKNPSALLQAYWHEFGASDDVCLVLKTYARDGSPADAEVIREKIKSIKQTMWINDAAPVVFIHENLSREEILSLHAAGDCFVLPHRAEGWGIPHFEAMAMNNTVIATGFSGNLEFMNEDNSLLINHTMAPCYGMDRPTYNGKMTWANPDIMDLAKKMRKVYEGYRPPVEPSTVLETFSWDKVGKQMVDLLKE